MDEDGIEIDRAILRALLKGLKKTSIFTATMFGLLTELVRSRWLEGIGQIPFSVLRVYGAEQMKCDHHY